MKNLLRGEEFAEMLLVSYLPAQLESAWWWPVLLWLALDLSMLGYAFGPRTGALVYNVVHHKATGIALYMVGVFAAALPLQLVGLVLWGHSAMERIFGYGLKFPDAFQHTHLGRIGKHKTV